jgi:hypothetical protein
MLLAGLLCCQKPARPAAARQAAAHYSFQWKNRKLTTVY